MKAMVHRILCYATKVKEEKMKIEDISMVCKFPDIFLEKLFGLPPQREIDFEIELIPRVQPILKAPYRMNPIELKRIQNSVGCVTTKRLIRPRISP